MPLCLRKSATGLVNFWLLNANNLVGSVMNEKSVALWRTVFVVHISSREKTFILTSFTSSLQPLVGTIDTDLIVTELDGCSEAFFITVSHMQSDLSRNNWSLNLIKKKKNEHHFWYFMALTSFFSTNWLTLFSYSRFSASCSAMNCCMWKTKPYQNRILKPIVYLRNMKTWYRFLGRGCP